jgi:hypothetical protein
MSEPPRPPRTLKVISAQRQRPITSARPLKDRLQGAVEDHGLNALSVVRESWDGLRAADRYFKVKALIVASWLVLAVTSLVVACPGAMHRGNALGAQLVITDVADHPVYMVKNDGKRPWKDVIVIVNHQFRAATAMVQPGNNITFGPKQLLGDNGQVAPDDLQISELELRTADGRATLLHGGEIK